MKKVQTVLGSISPDTLGITSMHEHVILHRPWYADSDANLDEVNVMTEELMYFKKAGGVSLVESSTPLNWSSKKIRQDLNDLETISKKTGINIIIATGFYIEPLINPIVYKLDSDGLVEKITKDITEGIEETGVKAGAIKAATSWGYIAKVEEKVLRVAARASLKTGAPIFLHTSVATMGMEVLDILESEGLDLARVAVGHLDDTARIAENFNSELGYHEAIAKRGAYVQYDSIHKTRTIPDTLRVKLIVNMIQKGYADQITLGQDISRKKYLKIYGGYGYSYLLEEFVPALLRNGVEEEVNKILVENPKKLLSF